MNTEALTCAHPPGTWSSGWLEILRNHFKESVLWERMKFWGGKRQLCKSVVVPGVVLAIFLLHPNRNRQLCLGAIQAKQLKPRQAYSEERWEHSCPQALSIHRAEQPLLRGFSTGISPGNGISCVILSLRKEEQVLEAPVLQCVQAPLSFPSPFHSSLFQSLRATIPHQLLTVTGHFSLYLFLTAPCVTC